MERTFLVSVWLEGGRKQCGRTRVFSPQAHQNVFSYTWVSSGCFFFFFFFFFLFRPVAFLFFCFFFLYFFSTYLYFFSCLFLYFSVVFFFFFFGSSFFGLCYLTKKIEVSIHNYFNKKMCYIFVLFNGDIIVNLYQLHFLTYNFFFQSNK